MKMVSSPVQHKKVVNILQNNFIKILQYCKSVATLCCNIAVKLQQR